MNKFLVIMLFCLIGISANAELIEGPANIRIKPTGDPIFSLNDHLEVACSKEKDGWFQIRVSVKISKQ